MSALFKVGHTDKRLLSMWSDATSCRNWYQWNLVLWHGSFEHNTQPAVLWEHRCLCPRNVCKNMSTIVFSGVLIYIWTEFVPWYRNCCKANININIVCLLCKNETEIVSHIKGFPRVLENNKLIFQVLEMPLNLTNQEMSCERFCLWKNPLKTKKPMNK